MLCKNCGLDMQIIGTVTAVEGDNSSETATKVYTVQKLSCKNNKCPSFEKTEEVRHLIYDGDSRQK